jgi:NAD(P)-dependent dehydrogenase (short-subunit alcohol dehydrogenase family)
LSRVALVTGAAHGIGLAVACHLCSAGWRVGVLDTKPRPLENVFTLQGDVGSPEDVKAFVGGCVARFGGVDLLVNNAGRMGPRRALEDTLLSEWDSILRTNLTGMFLMTRECAPHLRATPGASVVNIASTRAHMSEPDTFAYSASKGGIVALTHSLAASLAPVRVNCISPGWIDVEGEPLRPEDHAQHWSGRVGRPQDVAEMVAYLASAEFVTGAEFVLDGGMTRKMIYAD